MPNVIVTNLHTTAIVVPGGWYTDEILPSASATFDVPDTDDFVMMASVVDLVERGFIRVELEADSVDFRPIQTTPLANDLLVGAPPPVNPADYPEGYPIVALDGTGGGGVYLYLQVGGAWVPAN